MPRALGVPDARVRAGRRGERRRVRVDLPPPDVLEELDPLDELHREEPVVVVGDQLVEAHEVLVDDVGERAKLALEAVERARVEPGERLQRDARLTLAISRLVDDAARPCAEPPHDLVSCVTGEARCGHSERIARTFAPARCSSRDAPSDPRSDPSARTQPVTVRRRGDEAGMRGPRDLRNRSVFHLDDRGDVVHLRLETPMTDAAANAPANARFA